MELARAYNLTPPPNDKRDIEQSPTRLLHSKCLLQTHEEILKIQQRLNVAEYSYNEEILHRARSISHDQVSCADLHDDIRHLTEELEGVRDKVDAMDERLENIHDRVAEIDSNQLDRYNELMSNLESVEESLVEQMKSIEERWEEELEAVKKRIGALEERMQTVEVRLSIVEEKLDLLDGTVSILNMMRLNAFASRMNDPVTTIRIVRRGAYGNVEVLTEPSRRARWYWKLHRVDRHGDLVRLHRLFRTNWRLWSGRDPDDSEDDDSTDLNFGVGEPVTLEDAVARFPSVAVRILFGHLGLKYRRFEEVEARQKRAGLLPSARKRGNEDSDMQRERQRPCNDSWFGSTTEENTSLTGSG